MYVTQVQFCGESFVFFCLIFKSPFSANSAIVSVLGASQFWMLLLIACCYVNDRV